MPAQITKEFIHDRLDTLKTESVPKHHRMDNYERLYRMQVWKDRPKVGEYRVTVPTAVQIVEQVRALLVTRKPQINVPYNASDLSEQMRAQRVEKWLYGMFDRAGMMRHIRNAAWYALTLGEGCMKVAYDPWADEYEFPVVITSPDPRTVYATRSARGDRFTEVVHSWRRSRREVVEENNVKMQPPEGLSISKQAIWWDGEIDYTEYWTEQYVWEKVEAPARAPKLMTDYLAEAMQARTALSEKPPELVEAEAVADAETKGEDADEAPAAKKRVRKVMHAIVIRDRTDNTDNDLHGRWIKEPTHMVGYRCIPFVAWAGTDTPLGPQSILYPLANGDGGDNAMGLLAALSIIASIDLSTAIKSPNSPLFVDDAGEDVQIDDEPGAVNFVEKGTRVWRVPPDQSNPALIRIGEQLKGMVHTLSVPEVLSGNVFSLSGQAINGLASVFQMLLGFKQQDMEEAIAQLLMLGLQLAREWGGESGWKAFGTNAGGRSVDAVLKPDDIKNDERVVVKLSASVPRDEMAMVSMLVQLVDKKIISVETAQDIVQKLIGLAAETPMDETKRILRDIMLREGDIGKMLAKALGEEALSDLADSGIVSPDSVAAAKQMLAQPEPQPAGANPQGGSPPQGGTGLPPGMPPGAVTPDMLAASGNVPGAMNMEAGARVMPPAPAR